jgi:hypothetical protein
MVKLEMPKYIEYENYILVGFSNRYDALGRFRDIRGKCDECDILVYDNYQAHFFKKGSLKIQYAVTEFPGLNLGVNCEAIMKLPKDTFFKNRDYFGITCPQEINEYDQDYWSLAFSADVNTLVI